jgi:hypothetical protein
MSSCSCLLSCGDYTPTPTTSPSLRAACSERLPRKVPADLGASPSSKCFFVSISLSSNGGRSSHISDSSYAKHASGSSTVSEGADPSTMSISSLSVTRWTSRLLASRTPVRGISRRSRYRFPYFPVVASVFCYVLQYCWWLFSRFGGGRPLHKSISSLSVTRWTSRLLALRTPVRWISRKSCYRSPHFPVVAAVFCSVLQYCWRLSSFPQMSRLLMPFLHPGSFQRLFSSVRPFWVPFPTSCLFSLLRPCPLRRATRAQRGISLAAAANAFRGPQFSWVRTFLKKFPLRHATAAQQDTFLQAAANFFRDPQSPRASSFGSPHRPAARCRPLCRFFIVPEDFTAASSIGDF